MIPTERTKRSELSRGLLRNLLRGLGIEREDF